MALPDVTDLLREPLTIEGWSPAPIAVTVE